MPLHQKESVRESLAEDIYASADLSVSMPKYKIPEIQHDPRHAYAVVHDELMLDGNARQNFATFCQTWSEPEVHALIDECMDKNMIDKDEYPQCAEIESRCVHMLADLWNSPEEVLKRCDENTIGVVPTLGVTFTCQYEPIAAVAAALDKLQSQTGLDIPMHVDGASGGFLAPFCSPDLVWDFRIPRIKSINASGHKFGLAPLGVGWVIWREKEDLPEDLVFHVNYLGGDMIDFALNFSRPGGLIVAQYYNFLRLGKEGYRKIHTACYETAQFLAREIEKLGPFEILYGGEMEKGIPALCWRLKDEKAESYTLYDFANVLRARGWQVPAYSMPANRQDLVIQRILVRHGVSRDLASLLLDDMKRSLDFFAKHPVHASMTAEEAGGFMH